jgi:hypothetical protein
MVLIAESIGFERAAALEPIYFPIQIVPFQNDWTNLARTVDTR